MAETGTTLSLPTGDSICLHLPEIGGTAYLWHLMEPDTYDLLSDTYKVNDTAPGAETCRLLRLRPKKPGTHDLKLVRHRPWESANSADAEFQIKIISC